MKHSELFTACCVSALNPYTANLRKRLIIFFSILFIASAVQISHASSQNYRVVVGEFEDYNNALRWQQVLRCMNIDTVVEINCVQSGEFWRVALSSSYPDSMSAGYALNRIIQELGCQGYPTCDFRICEPEPPSVTRYYYPHPHYFYPLCELPRYLEFDGYDH